MKISLAVLAFLIGMNAAPAQTARQNALLDSVIQQAMDMWPGLLCGEDRMCAAATAQERRNPPVTRAMANSAMTRGQISGFAEHCGMNWNGQNYRPMMAHWRGQLNNERAAALLGVVHGMVQATAVNVARDNDICTETMRAELARDLPFRP